MTAGARSVVATRRLERSRWAGGFAVALGVCALAYAANVALFDVRAGNLWGLTYGSLATALLVAAVLYGWRRRSMRLGARLPLGSARAWLYLHAYGGALFLLLVLMHTGFRWPTGFLPWALWLLSCWTVLTGVLGLLLQKWIPRALASGLRHEVHYDRIPELIGQIRARADALVAGCGAPVRQLYARQIAPALVGPERRLSYAVDITGGIQARLRELRYLRRLQSDVEGKKLDELEQLFRAKLELDAHYTLQPVLRWWLWAHVPASLVLTALVAVHVLAVWYF